MGCRAGFATPDAPASNVTDADHYADKDTGLTTGHTAHLLAIVPVVASHPAVTGAGLRGFPRYHTVVSAAGYAWHPAGFFSSKPVLHFPPVKSPANAHVPVDPAAADAGREYDTRPIYSSLMAQK